MIRALGLTALMVPLLAVGRMNAQAASNLDEEGIIPKIVVSGHGEVTVVPDLATIVFAVETRAETAEAASAQNAERQQAVIQAIKSAGVATSDISTVGYRLHPEMSYEGKEPRVTGYVAQNSVRVTVRKIGETGQIIDTAIQAGANRVNSLSYESTRAAEALRQAMAKAVENARADAEAIARAAGGGLGMLIEVVAAGSGAPPPMPRMMAMEASRAVADTPIEPGEQTLSANIQVTWSFVPSGG